MREQILVSEFQKNTHELVRIHLNKWSGSIYIDIRTWFREKASDGAAYHPSPKGLRIHEELLPELIEGLQLAQAKADESRFACTETANNGNRI